MTLARVWRRQLYAALSDTLVVPAALFAAGGGSAPSSPAGLGLAQP